MTSLALALLPSTLLLVALSLLFLKGTRDHWKGITTCVGVLVVIPLVGFTVADAVGRPRPVQLDWLSSVPLTVLHAHADEHRGIFLTVQSEDNPEPKLLVIPWTEENAKKLYEAQRQAEAEGAPLGLRFERTWDKQTPLFYEMPQQAPPPKEEPQKPMQFNGQGRAA